jgi:hypothetical protein
MHSTDCAIARAFDNVEFHNLVYKSRKLQRACSCGGSKQANAVSLVVFATASCGSGREPHTKGMDGWLMGLIAGAAEHGWSVAAPKHR